MKKNYVTVALVFFAAIGFLIFNFSDRSSAVVYSDSDASFNRAYWNERIQRTGPEKTYQEFLEKNTSAPYTRQHNATHVIGELFYEHRGVEGIVFCDPSFGFGCFHGFFGFALATEGETLVEALDQACIDAYGPLGTGCQHGIGHGLLAYLGYDRLVDALRLCEKTTQLVPLLGCTSGVYMEHNTPLVSGEGNIQPAPLPFDEANPYSSCPGVPERFQQSCYFEIGSWWMQVSGKTPSELGALCAALENEENRSACARGLGNFLSFTTEYDAQKAVETCSAIVNPDVSLMCRAGVAWGFFSNPLYTERSAEPCDGLSKIDRDRCIRASDLTEGLHGT